MNNLIKKIIFTSNSSFTLIELLVVIAILAILAVVVVVVINPSELLKQARDSTRLSDLQTLNKAIALFQADQVGKSLGDPNTIYISIPDPTLSGNQTSTCSSLNLPQLPSGYQYHCVSKDNLTKIDGKGWAPVPLKDISYGSPIPKLPIDPINQTSTGEYYTYIPGGSWELTALLTSQKHQEKAINDGDAFPGVYSIRTSPKPLTPGIRDKGLV